MAASPLALALLLASLASLASAQTWPDCISSGFDNTGFDVIKGHRYSAEGCAHWCQDLTGCIKWVYKEIGQLCHLKVGRGQVMRSRSRSAKTQSQYYALTF